MLHKASFSSLTYNHAEGQELKALSLCYKK
nr:MAG TPA: hypothetical protein [Caudoviricetes sp.]